MKSTSYIEISESAIENNIQFIRNLIGTDVIFSSVVKGNAYGHGIDTYCPLLYKHGVRHYSVSDVGEAWAVRESLPQKDITIMIMSMIDTPHMEWAIENDIEFYVFEYGRLQAALTAAQKVGKPARIHIEIETGMNRTGFDPKEWGAVLSLVHTHRTHLKVIGVCTHLAGAESIANYKRIQEQQKKFKQLQSLLDTYDGPSPILHMASSAATIRYPKTRFHLVRVGILQYGFFPTEEIKVHYLTKHKTHHNPLKRIVSWKTNVMDIKTVPPGHFVGYGTSYLTTKTTQMAIIPVGYYSGFSRFLSNSGKVLIRGHRLNVIGTVNMNMMAVDITGVGAEKGDEVVLIGHQGDEEITVSSFSDLSQLINYELLTRLPHSIPRLIIP